MSLAEDRILLYMTERHNGYRPVACYNKVCFAENGGTCWRQLECFSRWIGMKYELHARPDKDLDDDDDKPKQVKS